MVLQGLSPFVEVFVAAARQSAGEGLAPTAIRLAHHGRPEREEIAHGVRSRVAFKAPLRGLPAPVQPGAQGPGRRAFSSVLVAATELDTRLVMRPLRNTERVLKNAATDRLLEKERALGPALTFADIAHDVSGVYPAIMQQGEMDAGVWSCGMVAGLIHDVPTVRELIDRIMADADQIIRRRLMGAVGV